METARKVLMDAKPCDIIEFDYGFKKHYAFYVGDGVCVHVIANEGNCCFSLSSSSSTPSVSTSLSSWFGEYFPSSSRLLTSSSFTPSSSSSRVSAVSAAASRAAYGTKIAQNLMAIAHQCKLCRIVNNFIWDMDAMVGKEKNRLNSDSIKLALEGIPLDDDDEIVLGQPVRVEYPPSIPADCRGYARHLKYLSLESAEEILKIVKPCDIIEFDRCGNAYKHYAFYIGKGVCVHVQGPDDKDDNPRSLSSSSAPSSNTPSSNMSQQFSAAFERSMNGTKVVQLLVDIAMGGKCRVNNFEKEAMKKNQQKRSENEAMELACADFILDVNGEHILGQSVPVQYELLSRANCEGYVTRWKYKSPGWSSQVEEFQAELALGAMGAMVAGLGAMTIAALVRR